LIPDGFREHAVQALVLSRLAITSKQQNDWQNHCLKAVKEPDPEKQMAIVAEVAISLPLKQLSRGFCN
jgi:hypothetical protein